MSLRDPISYAGGERNKCPLAGSPMPDRLEGKGQTNKQSTSAGEVAFLSLGGGGGGCNFPPQ